MCVPLGHRKPHSSHRREPLSKSQVENIIRTRDYECEYRRMNEREFTPYEGCDDNLIMILNQEDTTVRLADLRFKAYKSGYNTYVIDAPCFPATILLCVKW